MTFTRPGLFSSGENGTFEECSPSKERRITTVLEVTIVRSTHQFVRKRICSKVVPCPTFDQLILYNRSFLRAGASRAGSSAATPAGTTPRPSRDHARIGKSAPPPCDGGGTFTPEHCRPGPCRDRRPRVKWKWGRSRISEQAQPPRSTATAVLPKATFVDGRVLAPWHFDPKPQLATWLPAHNKNYRIICCLLIRKSNGRVAMRRP